MTGPLPWASERPLDAARVERVVASQFPALVPVSARFVDEGWDSEVYLVNGEWILRFPKRAEVVPWQDLERVLLPRLAPLLPVPIPAPTLLGEPCAEFPFRFLGYRRIEGVQALSLPPDSVDAVACARTLGALLSRLHAFSVEEARSLGVRTRPTRDPADLLARYAETWADVRDATPPAIAERGDAFFAATPAPTGAAPLVLTHGDITYDHLLLAPDGSGVKGLIDWGDATIADPAHDFAGIRAWFGGDFLRRVLDAYGSPIDPSLLDRTRRWAAYHAVSSVWWGLRGHRPRDVAAGLRGLDLSLPS